MAKIPTPDGSVTYDEGESRSDVRAVSNQVSKFFVFWKNEAELLNPKLNERSVVDAVLGRLASGQIECLDAVRVLANAGRSSAEIVLVRRMYESWVNMLAVAYPLVSGFTKAQIAHRFVALGHIQEHWMLGVLGKKVYEGIGVDAHRLSRRLSRRRSRIKATFGLKKTSDNWHPGGNTTELNQKIWKARDAGIIPSDVVIGDKDYWDRQFDMFFRYGSNHVHGSWAALTATVGFQTGHHALLQENRVYGSGHLKVALMLAGMGLYVVADRVGELYSVVERAVGFYGGGPSELAIARGITERARIRRKNP